MVRVVETEVGGGGQRRERANFEEDGVEGFEC